MSRAGDSRRRPRSTRLARVGAAAGLLGLGLATPAAAQPVPDCLPPAGTGTTGGETLTNRLVTPETIPDPVRLERGGDPVRYVLELETELRDDDPQVARNFEVIARLKAPDGTTIEDDALVVTAAAENERRIKVSVCLDPAPQSGTLDAGEYRAAIEFIDPRIPETALLFDVWVGGAAEATYVALAAVVGMLLLVVPPALIALQASLSGRRARAELEHVLSRWLGLLLIVALAGYLWAVFAFREGDGYHLWSLSGGWQEFLGFAFSKIGMTVTGFVAVLAFVPKFRQALGDALPPVAATATPEAPEARLPRAGRPRGGAPASGRPARAPARGRRVGPAIAALAGALVLIGGVFALRGDDGEDASVAPPTTNEPTDTPDVTPEDVLGDLDVGTTGGDEAAVRLRGIGFVVFDYLVCSNSMGEPGLLRQVRETESGAVVVDSGGPTSLAREVDPPDALDVLITSGESCDG